MKRFIAVVLVLTMIFSLGITAAAAEQRIEPKELYYRGISIYVNGTELIPQDVNGNSTEPFIIEGTTYLPVRALAGALGLSVGWDGTTNTITLTSGAEVNMGSGEAAKTKEIVNADVYYKGVKIYLDGAELIPTDVTGKYVEPFLMGGSTYLPLRAIATALGLEVGWDEKTNTITLDEPVVEEPTGMVWRLVKTTTTTSDKDGLAGALSTTLETEYLYSETGLFLGMFMTLMDFRVLDLNCTYAADGKLETLSLLTAEQEIVLSFAYNDKGDVKDISATLNGEFLARSSFTYSPDSLGGTVITEYVKDAAGKTSSKVTYQLDKNGNCYKIHYDLPEGGTDEYHLEMIINRTFDEDGRLLSEIAAIVPIPNLPDIIFPFASDSEAQDEVTSYGTGDSLNLPPIITVSEAYYTYDAMGNLLRYSFSSDEESFSYSYTYDNQGRETSCTFEITAPNYTKTVTTTVWAADGLSCVITSKTGQTVTTETLYYNEYGLPIRSEIISGNSSIITVYEYELFPYNGNDPLLDSILGELGQSR